MNWADIAAQQKRELEGFHEAARNRVDGHDSRTLSRLLWESRERISMHRDMVEAQTGQVDKNARRMIEEIDRYRAEHGWSPHGFGGEVDTEPNGATE